MLCTWCYCIIYNISYLNYKSPNSFCRRDCQGVVDTARTEGFWRPRHLLDQVIFRTAARRIVSSTILPCGKFLCHPKSCQPNRQVISHYWTCRHLSSPLSNSCCRSGRAGTVSGLGDHMRGKPQMRFGEPVAFVFVPEQFVIDLSPTHHDSITALISSGSEPAGAAAVWCIDRHIQSIYR